MKPKETRGAGEKTITRKDKREKNLECVKKEIILNLHFLQFLNEGSPSLGTLKFLPCAAFNVISVDKWLLSLLDQQEGWWTVVYERKHCFLKWVMVALLLEVKLEFV